MKRLILIITLITLLASVTMFTGCIRVDMSAKNGPITTREYSFTDFTAIEAGSIFEIEVIPSDNYSIAITTGENVLKRIHVSKSGSTLKIDMETWLFTWHTAPKVTITMPALYKLDLSGASKGDVKLFKSDHDFNLSLSGASELDIDMEMGKFIAQISGAGRVRGNIIASGSYIELSGAARMEINGSGGNMKLHGSGASSFSLEDYTLNDADVELSGTSHASLNLGGRLDVNLSGASSLEYAGSPTLGHTNTSGASSINQKTVH